MIFHALEGTDMRESKSPSFFNPEECEVVVDYVQKLLSSKLRVEGKDIGIITPYHRQVCLTMTNPSQCFDIPTFFCPR